MSKIYGDLRSEISRLRNIPLIWTLEVDTGPRRPGPQTATVFRQILHSKAISQSLYVRHVSVKAVCWRTNNNSFFCCSLSSLSPTTLDGCEARERVVFPPIRRCEAHEHFQLIRGSKLAIQFNPVDIWSLEIWSRSHSETRISPGAFRKQKIIRLVV